MNLKCEEDGLIIPEVGPWSEKKYDLISYYADCFATSMKKKWDCRVYIDLFSGCGYSQIKNTSRIVTGSPLIALQVKDKFDQYIFCEDDAEKLEALETRVKKHHSHTSVSYFLGNVNETIYGVVDEIPEPVKNEFKVLCFCVVDPYNI
ncbi:three-Cys-motif partner protein TcmP, partial [Calditrichota bacterium]